MATAHAGCDNLTQSSQQIVAVASPGVSLLYDSRSLLAPYPERAVRMGLGGVVVLTCTISDGALRGCQVSRESPGDQGFGRAALTAADKIRVAEADERSGVLIDVTFVFDTFAYGPMRCAN